MHFLSHLKRPRINELCSTVLHSPTRLATAIYSLGIGAPSRCGVSISVWRLEQLCMRTKIRRVQSHYDADCRSAPKAFYHVQLHPTSCSHKGDPIRDGTSGCQKKVLRQLGANLVLNLSNLFSKASSNVDSLLKFSTTKENPLDPFPFG